MLIEAFGQQRHADQQQETQRQHLDRRMPLDEVAERPAATIMITTAMTIAAIMIETSSTMPTAVITESSEKTISSSAICVSTDANDVGCAVPTRRLLPFQPLVNFVRALPQQEQAADEQDQIAAGNLLAPSVKSGAVSRTIQASESSSRMRVPMRQGQAQAPRARLLLGGSLPARMEMKMMLSMPRTISSSVSVARAIEDSGFSQFIQRLNISNRSSANPPISHYPL